MPTGAPGLGQARLCPAGVLALSGCRRLRHPGGGAQDVHRDRGRPQVVLDLADPNPQPRQRVQQTVVEFVAKG